MGVSVNFMYRKESGTVMAPTGTKNIKRTMEFRSPISSLRSFLMPATPAADT